VQTLNFKPYQVNLTPFAALLSNGQPHTIGLSVFNADDYFSATANLRLYLDSGSTQVTGAVTTNTLSAPVPNVTENLKDHVQGIHPWHRQHDLKPQLRNLRIREHLARHRHYHGRSR
jgi:hypothetical protein